MATVSSANGRVVHAVVFDLFGTLVRWSSDSVPSAAHVIWLKSPARQDLSLARLTEIIDGLDGEVLWDMSSKRRDFASVHCARIMSAIKFAGIGEPESIYELCIEAEKRRRLELFPDVLEGLNELRVRRVPWYVCSNASADVAPKLHALLPTELHPVGMALSCEVGALKPHPRMYETVADMAAPQVSLFVGDRLGPDVIGPKGFGYDPVWIRRDLQFEEFEEGVDDDHVQVGSIADVVMEIDRRQGVQF